MTGGIGHQSTHTGQLLDLLVRTTGSGVSHHVDVVVTIQTVQQRLGQDSVGVLPGLYNLFVTLFLGNQTTLIVTGNLIYGILCLFDQLRLLRRHGHVGNGYGHSRTGGILVSHRLDIVQYLCGSGGSVGIDNLLQDLLQTLLAYVEINFQYQLIARNRTVYEAQILRQNLVKEETAQGRFYDTGHLGSVSQGSGYADLDSGLQTDDFILISQDGFVQVLEELAFAFASRTLLGQIIDTKDHILGRNGYRTAVRRLQQVVRREQQETTLRLCLYGQGKMHCHLVSVEVRVERGTNQRMQLDSLTLYQNRLEGLDTKTMQGRSTVQHNRMLFDDVFQYIPYLRLYLTLYHFLCALDVVRGTVLYQLLHNEGLEQLDGHLLRETALINLQLRTNDDNGTSGIVNTLTQKILTETSGFTLQHVRQGLQRSVARAGNRTATASVVDQRVYRFLQHTLLVADDDIRCSQLEEAGQSVISVDNSAVQVVQVGGGETAAIQLYHGAQIGRDNRNRIQNHPLRLVTGLAEGLYDLQTLDDTGTFLSAGVLQACFQFYGLLLQIDGLQQLFDGLCSHAYPETIAVLLTHILILFFRQYLLVLKLGIACVQYNIGCEVQDLLQCTGRQVKDQSHTAGNALEVPDMRHRSSQLNVAHTLTADVRLCNLYSTTVADYAFIANLFILSAVALPVLAGSEDSFTE